MFWRAEVVHVLVLDPRQGYVNLVLAVDPDPVARKREIRPRHDLEAKDAHIEVFGALNIVGSDEVVIQFGHRHATSYGAMASLAGLSRCGDSKTDVQTDSGSSRDGGMSVDVRDATEWFSRESGDIEVVDVGIRRVQQIEHFEIEPEGFIHP